MGYCTHHMRFPGLFPEAPDLEDMAVCSGTYGGERAEERALVPRKPKWVGAAFRESPGPACGVVSPLLLNLGQNGLSASEQATISLSGVVCGTRRGMWHWRVIMWPRAMSGV